jgi:sugar phosphate isomerase/epimerase
VVDFAGVVAELEKVGFTGSLAIEMDLIAEPWVDTPEPELVTQSLNYLRELLASRPATAGAA